MKKIILLFSIIVAQINAIAQGPTFEWANIYGSSGNDEGRAIVTDGSGNIYTAGIFSGSIDFDLSASTSTMLSAGSTDIYILKLNSNGGLIWAKRIGGATDESVSDIDLDPTGNVIISGTFDGTVDFDPSGATTNLTGLGNVDAFVLKLDNNGNFIWAKAITGSAGPESAYHIAVDASDNIVVTGYFSGTVDFDPNAGTNLISSNGMSDIYILKYNSGGNLIWVKTLGAGASDQPSESLVDGSGNVYNVGFFQGNVDFDPSGSTYNIASQGGFEAYILKLDINGSFVWAKALQSATNEVIYSISNDVNGNLVVAGIFTGTTDFDPNGGTTSLTTNGNNDIFFGSYDNNGNLNWVKSLGSAGNDNANAISVFNDKIYLAGSFESFMDFNPGTGTNQLISNGNSDFYIAKYDINGNYIWAQSMGGTDWEILYEMYVGPTSAIYTVGYFATTTDFDFTAGNSSFTSVGIQDAFLHKMMGCSNTSSTINPIVCNSYTTPSGNNTYTTSGTYTDIIPNAAGCDSIITIELVIPTNCNSCEVANYPFNGNANDASGYLNHGIVNGATLTTDRFGNANSAYQFDGVNDNIISSFEGPSGNNSRTVSFWAKSSSTSIQVPIEYGNAGGGNTFQVIMNNACQGIGVDMSSGVVTAGTNTTDNNWHQYVIVYDAAFGAEINDVKFFRDGNLLSLSCGAGNQNAVLNTLIGNGLAIGSNNDQTTRWFNGAIDDVKIFSCALNQNQIDSLFSAEAPAQTCGLIANATVISPTCFGGNDGSIDLSVVGGTSPYTYQWSNSDNSEDISNLFAGNYLVIITDASGCDTMVNYTVNPGLELGLTVNVTSASCGQNDGSAYVNVDNGVSPIVYQWSNGDNTPIADSLSAGIYMLTVTDANGCSEAETFGVNNTGGLSLSANVTNATCQGVFNGAIDLTVTGGTSPYTYSWSNANTNQDLANIKPGAYMVEVTDNAGCMGVLTVNVGSSSVDLSNVNISNATCGNSDGSITINPSGGASPYTFQWSANAGSATTATVTNLPAGTYFVNVTDNNGCSESEMFSISNPTGPQLQLTSYTAAACSGGGGTVNVTVLSGMPPFTYEWSDGSTTQDLTNAPQGNYYLDVTDGNGCMSSLNVTLPGASLPPISLCMSTVNSVNGKVLCLWQKPALNYISHFNIYRENAIAGQFDFWFSRPFDSTSQWTDQSANPQIRGWRYKVTYVDTCGNESPMGTNHKTIHCITSPGLSGGVNIAWDHYEGFNFPTFYIERWHSTTGWITIDSVPSTLHTYFDTTTLTGMLMYAVNIESPSTCDPTRAGVNTSRSNVKNQPISATNEIAEEELIDLNIYPNPAQNEIFIAIGNYNGGNYTLKMFNAIGEMVHQQTVNSSQQKIDTRQFSSGMYTIQVIAENTQLMKKVVINK